MGTSIYHNMSVSQSCLRSFLYNPYYFLSNFLNFLFTCLPSFFCLSEAIFYKIYMVYRDVITMLIYGFTIISIFTFSEAFVGEIQHCLPEAICCYITLFTEIFSQS